jgi:hypothetical protein
VGRDGLRRKGVDMINDCRNCKSFEECYPTGSYVEVQLNAQIKRDLCVYNDKNDWEVREVES